LDALRHHRVPAVGSSRQFDSVLRSPIDLSSLTILPPLSQLLSLIQVMCLCWKQREKRLGIDDFGRPLVEADAFEQEDDERTPLVGAER